MGTVPILDVGYACIPQSKAIERFVSRRLGLLGIDPFEEALVDSVCELIRDMELAVHADGSRQVVVIMEDNSSFLCSVSAGPQHTSCLNLIM